MHFVLFFNLYYLIQTTYEYFLFYLIFFFLKYFSLNKKIKYIFIILILINLYYFIETSYEYFLFKLIFFLIYKFFKKLILNKI